jgi:hypothetical protein
MITYTKSNDSILWIHPYQPERQWSVNDSWSWILGNLKGNKSQIVINERLDAVIGKQKAKHSLPHHQNQRQRSETT